ncbi:MAG: flotillin family protein [Spirulina sp. SIO3F2]|nr:flotillin family protein [Spirulina sp. SIO3F2]
MKVWFLLLQSLPDLSEVELVNFDEEDAQTQSAWIIEQPTQSPLIAQTSTVDTLANMGGILVVGVAGFVGFIFLFLVALWTYKLFYVITPNNEAFVRTGGIWNKKKKVILNGGCMVLPGFHELTRVPLREIFIDVERTGALAVRTQDYLRANMRVTFYVCVNADEQDVSTAAARLSKQGKISEEDIKDALEKRADDAIRAAAKKKSLAEIDSDKIGFADEVLNLVEQDLKKVGLTLNNIAISEIEESDTYDENNFFDAQGVRLRTETIQRSIQQKREVELTTQVTIEQQELDAEKQSLTIAEQKEQAQLDQVKNLEAARLNQQQEIESLRLTQQQEIESLKAKRARETQEAQDQEAAKIERNKILQDQEVESSRLRAQIEVAAAQQESKIAQEAAAIAIVEKEKERLATEAERAQAEAAVQTAKEVEEAERDRRLSVIGAEQTAQEKQIAEQNVVEIDVFRRRRQAEIARQAAELEAESIRTLAEANRFKDLAEAQGQRALIDAANAVSTANRTAELIKELFPEVASQLPELAKSLAPQPGVLGDARIYAFPGSSGAEGGGNLGDINKLLLSTSGLELINSLLDEGKLLTLIQQLKGFLNDNEPGQASEPPTTPPNVVKIQTPPQDSF